jgi:hypothetical protein
MDFILRDQVPQIPGLELRCGRLGDRQGQGGGLQARARWPGSSPRAGPPDPARPAHEGRGLAAPGLAGGRGERRVVGRGGVVGGDEAARSGDREGDRRVDDGTTTPLASTTWARTRARSSKLEPTALSSVDSTRRAGGPAVRNTSRGPEAPHDATTSPGAKVTDHWRGEPSAGRGLAPRALPFSAHLHRRAVAVDLDGLGMRRQVGRRPVVGDVDLRRAAWRRRSWSAGPGRDPRRRSRAAGRRARRCAPRGSPAARPTSRRAACRRPSGRPVRSSRPAGLSILGQPLRSASPR